MERLEQSGWSRFGRTPSGDSPQLPADRLRACCHRPIASPARLLSDRGGAIVHAASRVLVVEDHLDLREMLAIMLEGEGFAVATASNGVEALERLHDACPSVILLDLMMPVMSGDEFRRRQLADERYSHVPVICLTAAHDGKERADRMQADVYFQKPVDFQDLLAAVRAYCH